MVGTNRDRVDLRSRTSLFRRLGRVFRSGATAAAVAVVLLVLAFAVALGVGASPSMLRFGAGFLTGSQWDLSRNIFGGAPAIAGTLLTSAFALLLGVPVALGVALFASELGPPRIRAPLAYLMDLGAAVPSVVYGFWALVVLRPFVENEVEPRLGGFTGGRFPFGGPQHGLDLLTASAVLAVMVIPTIAALARESLRAIPRQHRETALGLGATRWEATRLAVLRPAAPGLAGAIVLGFGRAVGETIAVALVIGGSFQVPGSLFSSSTTIPTALVDWFSEARGLELSALYELSLVLLLLSVAVNVGARALVRVLERERGFRPRPHHRGRRPMARDDAGAPISGLALPAWWPRVQSRQEARRLRRRAVHLVVLALCVAAVIVAAYPIASLGRTAVQNGGPAVVRPSFYTSEPPPACGVGQSGCPLGGIGPAIQGTVVLLGLASLIGLPVGILTGIFLSEYGRNRLGRSMGLLIDVLAGVPSILIGVFVLGLFLEGDPHDAQSVLAGGSALAVLMLPIVAKATTTALGTVPRSVRESALALGFPRHRVVLRVVLGSCRSALVTGGLLAVMRAGGETAALVLTAGTSAYWLTGLHSPTAALAPFIYYALTVFGSSNYTTDAWGAALVLLVLMGSVSLAARLALRTDRAFGGE